MKRFVLSIILLGLSTGTLITAQHEIPNLVALNSALSALSNQKSVSTAVSPSTLPAEETSAQPAQKSLTEKQVNQIKQWIKNNKTPTAQELHDLALDAETLHKLLIADGFNIRTFNNYSFDDELLLNNLVSIFDMERLQGLSQKQPDTQGKTLTEEQKEKINALLARKTKPTEEELTSLIMNDNITDIDTTPYQEEDAELLEKLKRKMLSITSTLT